MCVSSRESSLPAFPWRIFFFGSWEELDRCAIDALSRFGLRVVETEDKGRCLHAAKAFRRGELLMRQNPIACAMSMSASDAAHTTRCHHCHAPSSSSPLSSSSSSSSSSSPSSALLAVGSTQLQTTSGEATAAAPLKKCSRCKFAHYCSAEHQKAAWTMHSPECKRMSRCLERGQQPTATMVLLGRLYDQRHREAKGGVDGAGQEAGQRYADVETLATHWGMHSQDAMEGFAQVAQIMGAFMGWAEDEGVEMKELIEMMCRISCNGYAMTDGDMRSYGVGLYPLAALANHSCRPNAAHTFSKGGVIELRAMRDIEEGEEATISYIDVAQHVKARKEELLSRFRFDCKCPACECPGDGEEAKIGVRGDTGIAEKLDKDAGKGGWRNPGDHLAVCLRAVEACETAYHPLNVTLMRARERALKLAVSLGEFETAAGLCPGLMEAYLAHYPKGSPLIGIQSAMLGKLQSHLGR